MRAILLPALMMTLLLSGCRGAAPERRMEELKETLNAAQSVTLTADVTANLENEVFSCTLRCTAQPDAVAQRQHLGEEEAVEVVGIHAGEGDGRDVGGRLDLGDTVVVTGPVGRPFGTGGCFFSGSFFGKRGNAAEHHHGGQQKS